MSRPQQAFRSGSNEDEHVELAIVPSVTNPQDSPAHSDVMRAIRYLLYRYELSTGSSHLPQTIAVVSATSGEGATTVSRSLAEVLASERGSKVCWIGFDGGELRLLRPTPPDLSGIPSIVSEAPSNTPMVEPADSSSVRLFSANRHVAEIGRSFGRSEFADMLSELNNDYRYIVFDAPPLLSRTDSIGLLQHADAYLLVTRQGSTTLNQVRTIADELSTIPSLGAVLNNYRSRTPRFLRRFFSE